MRENDYRRAKMSAKGTLNILKESENMDRDLAAKWLERHDKEFAKQMAKKREKYWWKKY